MRLDKYLALSGERSRSEAARAVRGGGVRVNGELVRDPSMNIGQADEVTLMGEAVRADTYQYVLLHKPAGVLTAASDRHATTVMDLVPEALKRRNVLPVGRLDKDTTGLLLLTNDGAFAHSLLSPKSHVWKQYIATVEGMLTQADADAFGAGMVLSDFVAKPAGLRILHADEQRSEALVELREGKFHQVKRMFSARGHEVLSLHRVAFGSLTLPPELKEGEYRPLTNEELSALKECMNKAKRSQEEQHDA